MVQALEVVVTGLLVAGLVGFVAGCDSGGSNGGDGGDDGSGIEAPAAPSGLEGTSGDGEIVLEWDEVGEADSYNVYRSTSSTSGVEGDPLESGHGERSYTDGEVENGTTYYYRVTAVKSADGEEAESEGSDEVEKTPFDEPPNRPEN